MKEQQGSGQRPAGRSPAPAVTTIAAAPESAATVPSLAVRGQVAGAWIGEYRIVKVLGEGGMGTVYEAEQQEPRRAVALKVIRGGLLSPRLLRRFRHESQVLGRLQHPGIAPIYEAGTVKDESGRLVPFFAMEFVRGATLSEYLRQRNPDLRQRLEMLAKVADAVHHAHLSGVIHRDLKPANILVDDSGQPKILDFGVARAIDSDVQQTTMQTDVGQLIGTVPYMSPEQVGGDPDELDARSDVYALGVVAFEVLAGRLPYDLNRRLLPEAVRIIREEEPTHLSMIDRTFRGDIETIIAKALEKDRLRRYPSAEALASDIRRFLRDEPITARPASTWYQASKFARRNKGLVAGLAATMAVLVLGLVGTGYGLRQESKQRWLAQQNAQEASDQAQRAAAEAVRAQAAEAKADERADELEQVAQFQASQLSGIDTALMGSRLREATLRERRRAAEQGGGQDDIEASVRELERALEGVNFTNVALGSLEENIFDRALAAIDEEFGDQPLVQARLLQTLAEVMRNVGLISRATGPQERALAIFRAEAGEDDPLTIQATGSMGILLRVQGKLAEAQPFYERSLEAFRDAYGADDPNTLMAAQNLATLLQTRGELDESERYYRQAIEGYRRVAGEEDPGTLNAMNNFAVLLSATGRFAEAEATLRQVINVLRRVKGEDDPATLKSLSNLGEALQQQGKLQEAEELFIDLLERERHVHGDDHPSTANAVGFLGLMLMNQGRLAEAETYFRSAMESKRRVLGPEHPDTLLAISNVSALLQMQNKAQEAEPLAREVLEIRRRTLGEDHPATLQSHQNMAMILGRQGRYADAEVFARQAFEGHLRILGAGHPHTLIAMRGLSNLLADLERPDEARDLAIEAYRVAVSALDETHPVRQETIVSLGRMLTRMSYFPEAEARLLEAHTLPGQDLAHTLKVIDALGALYEVWDAAEPAKGHDLSARQWRSRLAEAGATTSPAGE